MPFTDDMPDDVRADYERLSADGQTPAALLGGAQSAHTQTQLDDAQKAREGLGLGSLSSFESWAFLHGTPSPDQIKAEKFDSPGFAMDAGGGKAPAGLSDGQSSGSSSGAGLTFAPGSGGSIQVMSDGKGISPGKPPDGLVDVFRQMQNPDTADTNTALVIDLWCLLDGGDSLITTGIRKAWGRVNFPCKLVGWTLLADPLGNVTVDVQKTDYATFPTFTSIVGATAPSISSGQKNTGPLGASDWTVVLSRGDIIRVDLTTNSAATLILLDLYAVRTDASDKTTN